MKIGVYNSAWGNVGNAFFAYGIISLLRKLFPRYEILELDEDLGPGEFRELDENDLCKVLKSFVMEK